MNKAIMALDKVKAKLEAVERQKSEPVAIIGVACRFPGGGDTPEAFFRFLKEGGDAVTQIPADRWRLDATEDAASTPERRATRWGAFLREPMDRFDARFFGVSPREAVHLDPQQRLLLEVGWEALERAGQDPARLVGTMTGVFVGISNNDYMELCKAAGPAGEDLYAATGNGHAFAAGRLSYAFGLQGPSVTVDTVCSSSIVAVHLACQSLRSGEATLGLAAGVNLMLCPDTMRLLATMGVLSPEGRCKSFDAAANGFVRGEGCGVVVLKLLSDAQRDGDPVLALIRGSAMNQNGKSQGLTTPNALSQQAMLRQALTSARVTPEEIGYVETQGTGTSLGDPIELEALRAVLGSPRLDGTSCALGAVKSNIGHLEAAAGVAGLIKAVMAFREEIIPRNLHFRALNPRVSLDGTPFVIPTENLAWPRGEKPRLAGVSAFGMSGTNAHLVLEEPPVPEPAAAPPEASSTLLPISAKSPEALRALAQSYAEVLAEADGARLADIAYTASVRRTHHEHRLAATGRTREEIAEALAMFVRNGVASGVVQGRAATAGRPRVVYVFSGEGSQWPGMGRKLLAEEPVFRAKLEQCSEMLRRYVSWTLLDELQAPKERSRLGETKVAQPTLFAIQVALVKLMKSWGVRADAVLGYGVGEVTAAHVAGVLSLEEAVRLVAWRGRILQKATGFGKMVWVALPAGEAAQAIAGREAVLSVAAIDDPGSVVLSGETEALDNVVASLTQQGMQSRALPVSYAAHSPQMTPLAKDLEAALGRLKLRRGAIPIYSTVTGAMIEGENLDSAYWARNVREPVQFARAAAAAFGDGNRLFLEVGPHPMLSANLAQCFAAEKEDAITTFTLRRQTGERRSMLDALGTLYTHGIDPEWKAIQPADARYAPLPTYPWQRKRYWVETPADNVVPDGRRAPASADPLPVDTAGAPMAELHGQEVLQLATGTPQRRPDEEFLELDWELAAVPAPTISAGRWLLLGTGGGVGSALRAALEAAGHVAVHAVTADTSSAAVRARLSGAFGAQAPTAVVHLGSLDADTPVLDAESIERALVCGCDSVLATVQALAGMGFRDAPRLWLVTRGAQAVGGRDVAASQSPLLGLGRVIALEHADLRCARVDLDPARPASEIQALLTELLADDAEQEVALRGEERRVARLAHSLPEAERREKVEPVRGRPFRLEIDEPGVLDRLVLRALSRRAPGPGEVEIAVEAAGLNFIDVMKAMGIYPGLGDGPVALGGECAGRIVSVGDGVERLRVDQEVIAVVPFAIGTHVTVDARMVVHRPATLSAAQAASLPAVLATAWYGLVHLGRLGAGERVLIHSATGGTGLAAVQIARHLGAEIFATAGTPEKRAWLRSQGVMHVMDSRSLDFAEQVMVATKGEGVDVVLNSLSGAAIEASLSTLGPDGRFIELGKTDIYADRPLGLSPFKKSLSYSAVDLAGLMARRPQRFAGLLDEVMTKLAQGLLDPLPVETFPVSRASEAFRKMAQAQHIGKLVLTLDDPEVQIRVPAASNVTVRADGSYLVTGGLGGLGSSVAGWLAERGAGHLVLVDRSGAASVEQQAAVAALQACGARVTVAAADVADRTQVEQILREVDASGMPLRGVIHAAGLLDDGPLAQQTPARRRTAMAPKVWGALHLHTLTREAPLDFFVMCASGAGLLGSPGQGNDAAASTFLDALAHHRRVQGLPALSIDWGAFSDVGLTAAQESRGMRSLTPDEGLSALEHLLDGRHTQVGVMPLDVRQWVGFNQAAASSRMLSRLMAEQRAGAGRPAGDRALVERLAAAEPGARAKLLQALVRAQASQVLRIPEGEIDVDAPLASMGMDSLMGLELRNRIAATLGTSLPATLLWTYPTIAALSAHLGDSALQAATAPSPQPTVDSTEALEDMSQDELTRMIAAEFEAIT